MMAVKQVPILHFLKKDTFDVRLESLKTEIKILSKLSHKNIVKYIGHHHDSLNNNFNIFLEYIPGGSIFILLKKYGKFNETMTRIYT
jgi:mitogen-activated protein kinase kinase kinase